MTTMRDDTTGLAGRFRRWIATRRRCAAEFDALISLDRLNERLARDAGLYRLRSAAPRRHDPWL